MSANPPVCLCRCRVLQRTPWMSCWAGTATTRSSWEIQTTWRSKRRHSTSLSSKVWSTNTHALIAWLANNNVLHKTPIKLECVNVRDSWPDPETWCMDAVTMPNMTTLPGGVKVPEIVFSNQHLAVSDDLLLERISNVSSSFCFSRDPLVCLFLSNLFSPV